MAQAQGKSQSKVKGKGKAKARVVEEEEEEEEEEDDEDEEDKQGKSHLSCFSSRLLTLLPGRFSSVAAARHAYWGVGQALALRSECEFSRCDSGTLGIASRRSSDRDHAPFSRRRPRLRIGLPRRTHGLDGARTPVYTGLATGARFDAPPQAGDQ